ncbi:MAG: hypothetical protein Q8N83_09240 [Ignavibacteria bacterium]|nr:hypothetical protein [Ignavibacteria bacterium]
MSEELVKNSTEVTKDISEKKPKEAKWVVGLREIIGGILWSFLIVKIFFFDIDIFFINAINPSWVVILNYKFFINLGILSILWITLGNDKFLKLISTILFFPWILLFWRIPKIFWKSKSWIGVFASIGIVFTFFSTLKTNFMNFTVISFSVLVVWISYSQPLLIIAMIFLFLYLIYHYAKRFKYAFKPSHIFTIQSEVINRYWSNIKDYFKLAEDIKAADFDNMSAIQKEKWCNNLQYLLIVNRLFFFITSKLRKFQKSRLNIIYYFVSMFFTLIVTVIIFSLQNFALFKIDPNSFNALPKGNFFFFIYYSFNTLFTNSINDFYPISDFARFLNSFETFFSFLFVAIVFFLFTTIIRDKHNEEITSVIETMTKKGHELEGLISVEYNMELLQAIRLVEEIKGNLIQVIYYFTKNIDDDSI